MLELVMANLLTLVRLDLTLEPTLAPRMPYEEVCAVLQCAEQQRKLIGIIT